jgi:hypothetical protein
MTEKKLWLITGALGEAWRAPLTRAYFRQASEAVFCRRWAD